MARKKAVETDVLLNLIDEFYVLQCNRDASLLKIPAIGEYIRSKGYSIQDYILRRSEPVREYIENQRSTSVDTYIKSVSVYRDIDIDAFLQKNNTPGKLKKSIMERENYYREITSSAAYSFKENKQLTQENEELKKENRKLQASLEKEKDSGDTANANYQALAKENKQLREIIDTYVYPEIANELLKKAGLIKETAGVIEEKKLEQEIVSADTDVTKIKNNVIKGLFNRL